jgi:hypothetical protein
MTLESRVALLEAKNRRLKQVVMAAGLVVVVLTAMGQARKEGPERIEAGQFVVVDNEGRERAVLGLEDGSPVLVITNGEGRETVRLEVPSVPDKPALYFTDPGEGHRMELAMTQTGPVLHFSDQRGVRARLATNELNAPLLAVYDDTGRSLFEVSKSGVKPGP